MSSQSHNTHLADMGQAADLPADSGPRNDRPDVDVQMMCELSQESPDGPFQAVLIREETRHWEDDPQPDIVETIVCEVELNAAPPDVFAEVDRWLLTGHRLRVNPATWTPGDTGPGTGVVVLLEARAIPATPVNACA
jgi:hypothetical protein